MKIALLGSAGSSVGKAPFQNAKSREWVEGKVLSSAKPDGTMEGDWEIWACSPGCWAVAPRITRFFEVHRFEPGQEWFSPEYCHFLRTFNGPVYTGAAIPEIPNHVVYPIDAMEAKFSAYFFTSSLALMLALAIDTIEQVRRARNGAMVSVAPELRQYLTETDNDDIIGLWGVDMSATEEYGYQRPGCQFFILEAMRRGIGVYLPKESDLMRPMPVYGISEWDHNYTKLTARARELNGVCQRLSNEIAAAQTRLNQEQGALGTLGAFVNTWTSPYGLQHGLVIRQEPGTGLGCGITHVDARPVERMVLGTPDLKVVPLGDGSAVAVPTPKPTEAGVSEVAAE